LGARSVFASQAIRLFFVCFDKINVRNKLDGRINFSLGTLKIPNKNAGLNLNKSFQKLCQN
jgi:hypothetical protein